MRLFKRKPKPEATQPKPPPNPEAFERDLIAQVRAAATSSRTMALMDEVERGINRRTSISPRPVSNDEAVLRMLAGANFGPGGAVVLPSGRRIEGDEAQALTSFYAPDAEDQR